MKPKLIFIGQFAPPYHGVAQMNEYALDVLKNNYEIYPINLSFSSRIQEVSRFGFLKFLKTINISLSILKLLIFKKVDIVYYTLCPTGIAFYRDCAIVSIIKMFNVNLIYHLHGQGIKKNSVYKKYDFLYSFVFNKCKVIHLSNIFYDEVEKYTDKKDFFSINNCVHVDQVTESQKSIGVNNNIKFIFLSNLMIGKGFLEYLEAIAVIHSFGYNFSATLVGDFFDKAAEEEYAKWEKKNTALTDSGIFARLPATFGNDKFKVLNEHDVFVFPTLIDTYPVVLIEAMASGLACISTDAGAIPEIIDDGRSGSIIRKGDFQGLIEAMIFYIENNNIVAEYKANAKLKYNNEFTLEAFGKKLYSVVSSRGPL